jgi:membrane dipeptidase
VLRLAYRLGARYLTLTHWDATGWSDSATAEPRHGGLSEEGKAAVLEMNRLGMMVDLSHASWDAMRDALGISRAPVIFSHSNAAALNSYPRNVPDDVLERLRENDGLVMVNFAAFFVSAELVTRVADLRAEEARLKALYPGDPDEVARLLEQWNDAHPMPRVRIADLVDHIDHIRQVAGVDHVGIGSDFDGIRLAPEGLEDVSGYPALLAELLRRGYSDEEVARIAGGSFLRVMRRVEQVASELRETELSADPVRLLVED